MYSTSAPIQLYTPKYVYTVKSLLNSTAMYIAYMCSEFKDIILRDPN